MTYHNIKYASMIDDTLIISVIYTNKQVHPSIDTLKTITVSNVKTLLTPNTFYTNDIVFTVDDQQYKITDETIIACNVYEYIQLPMWRKTIKTWIRRIISTKKVRSIHK